VRDQRGAGRSYDPDADLRRLTIPQHLADLDHVVDHLRQPSFDDVGEELAIERLVQRYGGIFHEEPNRVWVMLRAIFSGLVTPSEIQRLIHANNVTLDAMRQELLGLDLTRSVPTVQVPVLFCLGRYDHHLDARIAAAYFAALRAPIKQATWFENSAHNVPFEEARLFTSTILTTLQSMNVLGSQAD
jgi:pimeloyl-ACP methyl ester carboxylesterase